ncbi:MAG: exo-alpha-sialidase [Deltaproteobacteria bacterium]|jgi:hypothetical protein|nr:exo-alpha-sialidase [Deltaproteobacteria bacterium]MBT6432597.1 exo-alpha-sialidase [Deltaproteobacteria bacterium]MBT6491212.1 exo-alpha-sialidase [Deltaproteobacteria bacterium]
MRLFRLLMLPLLSCSAACTALGDAPSNDPADYVVDTSVSYALEVSEPRWVVPSDTIPVEIDVQESNNNVDICYFDGRLFMSWRSGPTHFASEDPQMHVMSSSDDGKTWEFEHTIDIGTDLREPRLISYQGKLQLLFFQAGVIMTAFEPQRILRTWRNGFQDWSELETVNPEPEVPWDIKVRNDRLFMTSYAGGHYEEDSDVEVYFKESTDGLTWEKVNGKENVYTGGVSEVAFEFAADGTLWLVTRNEDGDASGYGSHVCYAPADNITEWVCPAICDPERYDSPEMFRHGDTLYLVARRDIGGPYGPDDANVIDYSLRPKRTAIYQIDQEQKQVVHIMDIPGAGDTAFPAIWRTGPHSFLMANYTSPLDEPDVTWLEGQSSRRGTQIYLMDINFVAESGN